MKKFLIISVVIIAVLIAGAFKVESFLDKQFKRDVLTQGVITGLSKKESYQTVNGKRRTYTHTNTTISFVAEDGRRYSFLNENSVEQPQVGRNVTVAYYRSDPQGAEVYQKGTSVQITLAILFALFMVTAPAVLIAAGIIYYVLNNHGALKKKYIPVRAKVIKMTETPNQFGLYTIEFQALDNGQIFTQIMPLQQILKEEHPATVYINPKNPKKYFVEIQ